MGRRKRGIYNTTAMEEPRGNLRGSLTAAEAVLWKSLQRRRLNEEPTVFKWKYKLETISEPDV